MYLEDQERPPVELTGLRKITHVLYLVCGWERSPFYLSGSPPVFLAGLGKVSCLLCKAEDVLLVYFCLELGFLCTW
jgi:hypothetical protein